MICPPGASTSTANAFRHGASPRKTPSRPRVLMTVDAVGGVWPYAMALAQALRPLGFHTVFAGFGPRPSRADEYEAFRNGELVWTREPLDWMVKNERRLDGTARALEELADALDIDILHLNLPSQACGIETRLPVVVVSHSCVATWWQAVRGTPLPAEWDWQIRRNSEGFARADAIIAPSRSHADLVRCCYGSLPRLTVIHNSVGGLFSDTTKQDFVFAAGRWWDEGKNAALLDAAAARSPWPVRMAGDLAGPDGQRVALRHAHSLGRLPHMAVLDEVRRAGIVVSPSLYEPFGLLALEGARAAAPLILADIPTYRELWSQAALFFDPHDPDALAAAIDRVAAHRDVQREMGARALERSQSFTPQLQARAMSDVYRALLAASSLSWSS